MKFTLFSKLFSVSHGGKRLIHLVNKQRSYFSTFSSINIKEKKKNLCVQSKNSSSIFKKSSGDKTDDLPEREKKKVA